MMQPVNKDVKEAVLGADKFLSVTLTQEKLSPSTEKERSLLAEKFKNLITQLGLQSELPARGCKAPPRPPKGGISIPAPVTNGAGQEGEELYDDIAGVIPDDQYYSPMGPSGEEESSNTDAGGENYEIMSGDTEPLNTAPHGDAVVEEYVAMEDDNAQGGQEDYEEPGQQAEQKQQDSAPQEEEYEMPGTDPDYEETENPPADDVYEGVEPADDNPTTGEGSVDGAPNRERTVTVNMENLMKDTKPENIEGVILQGFLHKHRKEGKVYIGSKYQKRFCVVRNHMLYYFKDKKSPKQQGCILLPGYQVTTANKKGREFTLSHPEGHRSFQFEATSKKEADKWITALQSAANAPLSMRNSVNLDELRNKQPSGDEDSLHYDDLGQSNTSTTEVQQEANEDVYDDTNEDLYEVVGSVQLSAPSQPSNPQLAEYEITGASATSPKPAAEPSPAEPVVDEDYELPGQSPVPALPPPRPVKSVTQPPQDEVPPVVPPPRPSKAPPPSPKSPAPTPLIQDDTYEIADTPEDTKAPPPPPSGEIELEDYEALDTFQEPLPPPPMPAPVPPGGPVRPPKRKVSPPSGAGQAKSQENVPERPGVKPTPPVPAREDETPPSLAEEKTSYINYANVYQALWDCTADEEEELGFRRGDLIYIYEKPHADWWIGSLFKPQGYSVGLVPKDYVMEAYEFTAA